MSIEKRSPADPNPGKLSTGLVLAKVVGYLDPSFMSGLEVTLLRDNGNSIGDLGQTFNVKYASPFYGVTAFENMGQNKDDFNDTQKSYGMWFPTPEIGTTVLCAFVDGNAAEGYWIACIPGRFMNHMIPAIGGSKAVELTDEQKKKYDTVLPLPVAEINRKTNELDKKLQIEKIKRPVHPIADRFLEQGLLEDDIRGTTTSTSRRSIPNTVFGISTPGPVDRGQGAKKQFIGKAQAQTRSAVPVSRLGGSTLVFDDGDDQFVRKTPASEGSQVYADTLNNEKGNVDIPYNEYVRLRTRTGHQILLHNSEDLIYIGNARGTSWIELTSNGKIDIYAQDSVSIHTESDLNIRADRDINFEAGRNVNIKAAGGKMQLESVGSVNIIAAADGKITVGTGFDLVSGSGTKFSSGGATNIKSSDTNIDGGNINLNSGLALAATPASPLSTHPNISTSTASGWVKKRYQSGNISSIMKRIPMHEPWPLHENLAPNLLTPSSTDRDS